MELLEQSQGVVARSVELAERLHREGHPIVGICCEYAPRELILAAGAVPVCLCGGSNGPIAAAEEDLPTTLCPLIKSTYGFAITGTCPFLGPADLIVAETTCDGKKKMYELLAERVGQDVHVLELPQKPQEPEALAHWVAELGKLKDLLEARYGRAITDEGLRAAIETMNVERALIRRAHDYSRLDPPVVTGRELQQIRPMLGGVPEEADRLCAAISALEERRMARRHPLPGAARILLTGTPMVTGMNKVIDIIEGAGAVVVVQETCSGLKSVWDDIPLDGDPLARIAERYLALPCSCMTPNLRRFELLSRLIEDFRPTGVIELLWHACLTYAVEAHAVSRHITQRHGLPYLHIETDYSDSDAEQLRTRIEGFIEMIAPGPPPGRG